MRDVTRNKLCIDGRKEAWNQSQKLCSEHTIRFIAPHFCNTGHQNDPSKIVLTIEAYIIADDETTVRPACQNGLLEIQGRDHSLDIICPILALLKSCHIAQLIGETMS